MTDTRRDLHPLEQQLLEFLAEQGPSPDMKIIEASELPDEGSFRRAAQWLLSRGLVREVSRETETRVELGPVGKAYLSIGITPELLFLDKVCKSGGPIFFSEIQEDATFDKAQWGSAYGALSRSGTVSREDNGELRCGDEDTQKGYRLVWRTVYKPQERGEQVAFSDLPPVVADYVIARSPKRGKGRAEFVLVEDVRIMLEITDEGSAVLTASLDTVTIGSLTPDILADGSWKDARFREYQVDIPPSRMHLGRLHPYRQLLDTVRKKFTAMGFVEMRGSMAESEFWNNDALFMPQFHPARDIHDAYFLESGASVEPPPEELLDSVIQVHETGGDTGGRGWDYTFSRERALRAVLRSQGTALSARCLASNPRIPGKYFAIARCFRYDQVDSTHLPDFFQVEGIVLSEDTNFQRLLGLLRLFAVEIAGADEYRFTPSYFPFTEPSVEVHVKHPKLGWMELGGAGLFREEVCAPLGIDVPVIAWGLGMDRMAMLVLGLDDIRDLFTGDLSKLRKMASKPDRLLSSLEEVTG